MTEEREYDVFNDCIIEITAMYKCVGHPAYHECRDALFGTVSEIEVGGLLLEEIYDVLSLFGAFGDVRRAPSHDRGRGENVILQLVHHLW